jgi:hypothetical protein
MATRESINRIKIEHWRVSRVPVNRAEDIYQGDLLAWDTTNKRASRLTASASAAGFIGISDTKVSVETAGSTTFLSPTTTDRVNVIQSGLVELIWGTAETVYPFDEVVIDTAAVDAQTVRKGASNPIGVVDPGYGAAGKAVVSGDLVKVWLQVRSNQYNVHK